MKYIYIFTLLILLVYVTTTHADVSPDTINQAKKSVVIVRASTENPSSTRNGSGFFISPTMILTSNHIIHNTKRIVVQRDENSIPEYASLKGFDQRADVALLQVDTPNENWLDITTSITPGEPLFTIGHPYNSWYTITQGIVSSLVYDVIYPDLLLLYTEAIMKPGNSGGPILNKDNQVLGIVRHRTEEGNVIKSYAASSMSFANTITKMAEGNSIQTPHTGVVLGMDGNKLVVVDVLNPAKKVGIQKDDVIVMVTHNGFDITHRHDRVVYNAQPGTNVTYTVFRNGRFLFFTVKVEMQQQNYPHSSK